MNHLTTDTIAALATAPGKSGICVVRVSGPNSGAVAKQILDFDPTPRTAHLSKFKDENGDIIDEGIALFLKVQPLLLARMCSSFRVMADLVFKNYC